MTMDQARHCCASFQNCFQLSMIVVVWKEMRDSKDHLVKNPVFEASLELREVSPLHKDWTLASMEAVLQETKISFMKNPKNENITNWLGHLRILHTFRYGTDFERACPCESWCFRVKRRTDWFFITFLFSLQANSECTAYGVTQSFPSVFDRVETVTHPPARSTISANVTESTFIATIWCTKGYFFDGLIQY